MKLICLSYLHSGNLILDIKTAKGNFVDKSFVASCRNDKSCNNIIVWNANVMLWYNCLIKYSEVESTP